MEHSLVLSTCGTDSAIEVHCTVRDALTSVAPECNSSLSPLLIACDLVKLKEGKHVTKRVLVHSLMRCGNTRRAEGIVAHLGDEAILGIFYGIVHHPGTEIPCDLLSACDILLVSRYVVESKSITKQGRSGLLVDRIGIKSTCGGKAVTLKSLIVEVKSTDSGVEVLLLARLLVRGDYRKHKERTDSTLLGSEVTLVVP